MSQQNNNTFYKKETNLLLQAREMLGVSQEKMGDLLGITKNYVYLLEKGKKDLTEKMIKKIRFILSNKDNPSLINGKLQPSLMDTIRMESPVDSEVDLLSKYGSNAVFAKKITDLSREIQDIKGRLNSVEVLLLKFFARESERKA